MKARYFLKSPARVTQRGLLAGEQSAVGIGDRGLRGGEVDAVQGEPLLQLDLFLWRSGALYGDLRGCVFLAAAAVTHVAGNGICAGSNAGGIELNVGAGAGNAATAGGVAVSQLVIVRITGGGGDAGALADGDGGRIGSARDRRRRVGLLFNFEIGGSVGGAAAAIVNGDGGGVCADLDAIGVPANFSAGAFDAAAGGGPFVIQRVIVRIGGLGLEHDAVTGAGKNLGGIGGDGDRGRMVGRWRRRIAAEVQNQSGSGAYVVLLVVIAVSKFGQQIFGLKQAGADVLVEVYIHAAAKGRGKGVLQKTSG